MTNDPFPLPTCILEPFDHKHDIQFPGNDMYVLVEDRGETVVYAGFHLIEEGQYIQWSDDHGDFVFQAAENVNLRHDTPPVADVHEWPREAVFEALMQTGANTATFTPYALRRACENWVEAGEEPYWESLQGITFTDKGGGELAVSGQFRKGVRKTDKYDTPSLA